MKGKFSLTGWLCRPKLSSPVGGPIEMGHKSHMGPLWKFQPNVDWPTESLGRFSSFAVLEAICGWSGGNGVYDGARDCRCSWWKRWRGRRWRRRKPKSLVVGPRRHRTDRLGNLILLERVRRGFAPHALQGLLRRFSLRRRRCLRFLRSTPGLRNPQGRIFFSS